MVGLYLLANTRRPPLIVRLLGTVLMRRDVRRAVKRVEAQRRRARTDALLAAGIICLAAGGAAARRRRGTDADP